MNCLVRWGIALAGGAFLAWLASSAMMYALEPPEIRDYVPGHPVFSRPVTEGYDKLIIQDLNEKLDREAVMQRFENTHSLVVIALVRAAAFLIDPINLCLVACFFWPLYLLLKRFSGAGPAR